MPAGCSALSHDECVARYKKAIEDRPLKIMAKMASPCCRRIAEAATGSGRLSWRVLVNDFFPGMPAKLLWVKAFNRCSSMPRCAEGAFDDDVTRAAGIGGCNRYRAGPEAYYQAGMIHLLQHAVGPISDSFEVQCGQFAETVADSVARPTDFVPTHGVPIEEAESPKSANGSSRQAL
jgi:glutamate synthase (NADPH/NADH) large chain